MAFFDEWKEKWESWSLAVKGAVICGGLLLLVGVGGRSFSLILKEK